MIIGWVVTTLIFEISFRNINEATLSTYLRDHDLHLGSMSSIKEMQDD